jgi:hypothetical protein
MPPHCRGRSSETTIPIHITLPTQSIAANRSRTVDIFSRLIDLGSRVLRTPKIKRMAKPPSWKSLLNQDHYFEREAGSATGRLTENN